MVGSILDGTEAVRVTPNSIRLLDSSTREPTVSYEYSLTLFDAADLQEVQRIEPETPTSIVRAYVVSPYVLVERRDRTPLLYRADHDTAKLQKVILPEVRWPQHPVLADAYGTRQELAVVSSTLFSAALPRFVESLPEPISKAQAIAQPEDDEDDLYGSPAKKRKLSPSLGQTPQQILAPVTQEVYISVINDKGDLNVRRILSKTVAASDSDLQVLSLPELNLVYSAPSVDRLPEVLQRFDEPEAPAFGDLDEESATRQVEQHRLFQAGGAHPTTHLTASFHYSFDASFLNFDCRRSSSKAEPWRLIGAPRTSKPPTPASPASWRALSSSWLHGTSNRRRQRKTGLDPLSERSCHMRTLLTDQGRS